MSVASGSVVAPGDLLTPSASQYRCGSGCFARDGKVFAALSGRVNVVLSSNPAEPARIEVAHLNMPPTRVPHIGDIVICRVTRINPRLAQMQILTVGDQPLEQPFQGIVRVQDIRAMQIDTASVYASFRPGDIVRAQVLSLGTARSFYLTTARNDLGVVLAQDGQLTPISWCEVMDPKTGTREPRKVAKP